LPRSSVPNWHAALSVSVEVTPSRRTPLEATIVLVAAGAIVLSLATSCRESGAPAPPTFRDLVLADAQAPPVRVPGLSGLTPQYDIPVESQPVPTRRACVSTWNSKPPQKAVRWIAEHATQEAALVTLYEVLVGSIGDNSSSRVWTDCAFGFVVGPRQLAVVLAPPPNSEQAWKGEIVRYRHRGTITTLVTRFNASLDRAGRLRLL
jgi:hypothetical protein